LDGASSTSSPVVPSVGYWFDTVFHEDGSAIDLVSIGVVAEDGRTYHAVSAACDWARATPWPLENLRPLVRALMDAY
jgi:hypothetical protein